MIDKERVSTKAVRRREIWFPWRKKGILIRGREGNFWEPFAVSLSALALLVSGATLLVTWSQAGIMEKQLVSADRNKASQALTEEILLYCSLLSEPPAHPQEFVFVDEHGRQYVERFHTEASLESIITEVENSYFADLRKARSKVSLALASYMQWADDKERQAVLGLAGRLRPAPERISTLAAQRLDSYNEVVRHANDCGYAYAGIINIFIKQDLVIPPVYHQFELVDVAEVKKRPGYLGRVIFKNANEPAVDE